MWFAALPEWASQVRVHAKTDKRFELAAYNKDELISAVAMDRLFQPLAMGDVLPNQQDLRLGRYIESEIVRVHGGKN